MLSKSASIRWIRIQLAIVALLFLGSCQTYKLAREEVFPCVGDCLVQTGPKLMLALWEDVKTVLGTPPAFVEGLLGKEEETEGP